VLNGCESRDVMSSKRRRRFFLDSGRWSTSDVGRDRFGDSLCVFFLNLSGVDNPGTAWKAKTVDSGSENGEKSMMVMDIWPSYEGILSLQIIK
jgi:hypothetical protein